jgi:hypothetical protein
MLIEKGTEYQISDRTKRNFNSAEALTIIRQNENVIQFTLKDGKGHGSMPIQHFQYLVNKKDLILNKRVYLNEDNENLLII